MQKSLFALPDGVKKDQRGRPKIKISVEIQCLIRHAIRGGMSREAIGHALGIDPGTVRKYFSPFCEVGDQAAIQAAERLRKMGSELHRISDQMKAAAQSNKVFEGDE